MFPNVLEVTNLLAAMRRLTTANVKFFIEVTCIRIIGLILRVVNCLVSEGRGRLFRRKDGKYLIYLPKDLAEDSMFPFKGADSIFVKVSFKLKGDNLLVEKWVEPKPEE
jgi:hypothetical protein